MRCPAAFALLCDTLFRKLSIQPSIMKSATLIFRVLTVLFILSLSIQASAQQAPNQYQNLDDKMFYTSKYYKFKKMKTVGLIMTLGGGLLGVVGFSKMANAPTTTSYNGQVTYTTSDGNQGAAMFLVSVPLVGAGLPLAIVGNAKSKKYGRLMESASISPSLAPGRRGLTLTYKF